MKVSARTAALTRAIPALPVRDVPRALDHYRGRVGFAVVHQDGGFAVLRRGDAEIHVWQAGDEGWRHRDAFAEFPVASGAESFIAGTASCRIETGAVDDLYAELAPHGVLHPVSRNGVTATDFGTREFATLDPDGNLVTFFERVAA